MKNIFALLKSLRLIEYSTYKNTLANDGSKVLQTIILTFYIF